LRPGLLPRDQSSKRGGCWPNPVACCSQVASGRRSMDELPSMGTQRVSTSAAYRRALAAQSTAVSPLTLTLGFLKVAFDAVINPSVRLDWH